MLTRMDKCSKFLRNTEKFSTYRRSDTTRVEFTTEFCKTRMRRPPLSASPRNSAEELWVDKPKSKSSEKRNSN